MSEQEKDPAATTHQFQAFAGRNASPDGVQIPKGNTGLILGGVAIAALAIVAVIIYLMIG